MTKLTRRITATALSLGVAGWVLPISANTGISITQRDGNVSLEKCVGGAEQALQKLKFENIRTSKTHVEADFAEYSALVTCYRVESTEGVVVQAVIVAGPDSKAAGQLGSRLVKVMP